MFAARAGFWSPFSVDVDELKAFWAECCILACLFINSSYWTRGKYEGLAPRVPGAYEKLDGHYSTEMQFEMDISC